MEVFNCMERERDTYIYSYLFGNGLNIPHYMAHRSYTITLLLEKTMKILSFSCVGKLPALLRWRDEKTEWQTIRPAWKDIRGIDETKLNHIALTSNGVEPEFEILKSHHDIILKPPRFQIGERIQLYWKQRSTYHHFKKSDGIGTRFTDEVVERSRVMRVGAVEYFQKLLGTGPVIKIFRIEMGFEQQFPEDPCEEERDVFYIDTFENWEKSMSRTHHLGTYRDELANRDGIGKGTLREFIDFFSKNYDLSTPKPFYIFRGGWD